MFPLGMEKKRKKKKESMENLRGAAADRSSRVFVGMTGGERGGRGSSVWGGRL